MDDRWVNTTEHFDHLFNKVWDKVKIIDCILNERVLPSEQQIQESWRSMQLRLNIEQTNRENGDFTMNPYEELNNDKRFEVLNTTQLIETYELAKELNLSLDFQNLLASAIKLRFFQ